MYGYDLFHAYPILTETQWGISLGEQQLACRRAPLPIIAVRSWSVSSTFNSFNRVLLVIVLLEQTLTGFCIILVQMTEGLDRTSE